ncbi:MAG: hypothetical protein IT330_11445 [Anaerolineae bacterium]|nr:hypothetical protein [Anaerolineae bacterium]
MATQDTESVIFAEVTVPASLDDVWAAWTTEEGTVLPRLRYRFTVGPVDWEHRPDFGEE